MLIFSFPYSSTTYFGGFHVAALHSRLVIDPARPDAVPVGVDQKRQEHAGRERGPCPAWSRPCRTALEPPTGSITAGRLPLTRWTVLSLLRATSPLMFHREQGKRWPADTLLGPGKNRPCSLPVDYTPATGIRPDPRSVNTYLSSARDALPTPYGRGANFCNRLIGSDRAVPVACSHPYKISVGVWGGGAPDHPRSGPTPRTSGV